MLYPLSYGGSGGTTLQAPGVQAETGVRAEQCEQQHGRLPTFLAVDVYDRGDLFGVVDILNGRTISSGASAGAVSRADMAAA